MVSSFSICLEIPYGSKLKSSNPEIPKGRNYLPAASEDAGEIQIKCKCPDLRPRASVHVDGGLCPGM